MMPRYRVYNSKYGTTHYIQADYWQSEGDGYVTFYDRRTLDDGTPAQPWIKGATLEATAVITEVDEMKKSIGHGKHTRHPAAADHKVGCECELCKVKDRNPDSPTAHWKPEEVDDG